jgi:hypothetical protein
VIVIKLVYWITKRAGLTGEVEAVESVGSTLEPASFHMLQRMRNPETILAACVTNNCGLFRRETLTLPRTDLGGFSL